MEGKIKLLDVGDGDAMIVHLRKNDKDLLMVVDGGQPWHYKRVMKPVLDPILEELDKKAPDIVVATHYDSDHIGGLIPLIEEYMDDIKEVWVHRSPELDEDEKQLLNSFERMQNAKSFDQFVFEGNLINQHSSIKEEAIREKSQFVIDSIRQLRTFLGLIPESKVRQVYNGDSVSGWPEIKVIGPTQQFFNELFPSNKRLSQIVIEETIDYTNDSLLNLRKRNLELISHGESPCKLLKDDTTVRLTPTNKASIIFAIDNGDDRYLFTGDAGISSFKAIPDWRTELKNLHWLKIPHHGSDNNISKEIIDVMKPKLADNSGDKYQDLSVMNCISANSRSDRKARSTRTHGSIEILI